MPDTPSDSNLNNNNNKLLNVLIKLKLSITFSALSMLYCSPMFIVPQSAEYFLIHSQF